MLEAKGVTPFSNKQFKHKMERLRAIFGEDGRRFPQIKNYFGLISPYKSRGLQSEFCPSWLKQKDEIPWIEMSLPKDRLTVFGCDEQGKPNKNHAFWTIRKG